MELLASDDIIIYLVQIDQVQVLRRAVLRSGLLRSHLGFLSLSLAEGLSSTSILSVLSAREEVLDREESPFDFEIGLE